MQLFAFSKFMHNDPNKQKIHFPQKNQNLSIQNAPTHNYLLALNKNLSNQEIFINSTKLKYYRIQNTGPYKSCQRRQW